MKRPAQLTDAKVTDAVLLCLRLTFAAVADRFCELLRPCRHRGEIRLTRKKKGDRERVSNAWPMAQTPQDKLHALRRKLGW